MKLALVLAIVAGLYVLICALLYFFQERLIFFPEKLTADYQFEFEQPFNEVNLTMPDGVTINALHFSIENSKGIVFYLHGNAGSLRSWGNVAKTYTALSYEVFIIDYRGYGKSEGKITSQTQLFADNQFIYDQLKQQYGEDNIVLLGYSLGSGLAAKLAADNHPKQLILQAPYSSLVNMMKQRFALIPTFLLKYKLETTKYLQNNQTPITIFHGNQDSVISHEHSLTLKPLLKPNDKLIILDGQDHNGMTDNPLYRDELAKILQ